MPFHTHASQAAFRQAGERGVGVVFLHLGEGCSGEVPLLQLVVGVTHFQQSIRYFRTFGKPLPQVFKGRECKLVISGHIVGFTQPVLCVI